MHLRCPIVLSARTGSCPEEHRTPAPLLGSSETAQRILRLFAWQMDLQNAQLLVLTLFLGSALVMPNNPYSRWLLLWGGQSQPAASLSWADPWMLQWIAEQEEKQAKDPIPGALPSPERES